ncbi:STY4534 family ICE replication protein [Thioalkalivibrio sp.]|uniref:STY4534 family ICE replication protein n=1 Tax=Thioalkalivibrio sp. TaxID=2093813 RepID=UPI0012D50E8D|nr:STY4534 family ICE replication protein [Thioalkalivibrio sp.]TVP80704.1 MAG: DUF3577 domain-containing protein [Thioalkalivibrio sp.]
MTDKKYFDLHVTGIGYLGRAREVPVRRGEPFLALEINALHGAADQVEYTRFDCRVTGGEAQMLVRRFMPRINDRDAKVLVGFRLGDLYPDVFTYQTGEKAGQTGVSLKARLLKIHWIKVNGEWVYTAEASEEGTTIPEPETASTGAVAQVAEDEGSPLPVTDAEDDLSAYLPEEVELSKDDPDFLSKKEQLKASGYRFDGTRKVWRLPAVA